MFDSIYTGMSGLISYSKGLSGIGNNVANMNTPGFKGSDLEFLDLFYRYQYSGSPDQGASPYTQGGGVQTGASVTRLPRAISGRPATRWMPRSTATASSYCEPTGARSTLARASSSSIRRASWSVGRTAPRWRVTRVAV
jgi:hypothetical protein